MLDNEKDLIIKAQKGEAECFGHLYDHYLPQLHRYVFLKVGSKQEAEDLTHEVFLSAWQSLPGYKSKGFPFSSWLYHIARNKVIDHYRTKKVQISIDLVDESFFKLASTLEKDLDIAMHWAKAQVAIKKLKEEQQDVIIMRFVEDLSHKEIADAIGKSEGAVRLIQHRALENLRDLMEENHKNG
jgi:RNA polymerase sigma-70 factor (ECF subfamily)